MYQIKLNRCNSFMDGWMDRWIVINIVRLHHRPLVAGPDGDAVALAKRPFTSEAVVACSSGRSVPVPSLLFYILWMLSINASGGHFFRVVLCCVARWLPRCRARWMESRRGGLSVRPRGGKTGGRWRRERRRRRDLPACHTRLGEMKQSR